MDRTFRPRQSLRVWMIAATALFSAITIFYATIPLYIRPGEHGFEREGSTFIVAVLGALVFGVMWLVSIYGLIAVCVEQFKIEGTIISIRTVFRRSRFDVTEVERVRWNAPRRRIVFHTGEHKTAFDLYGYGPDDLLGIVRAVRALVPEARQDGWPLFCLKVAVPLRDRTSSLELVHSLKVPSDPGAFLLVTRRRYDRLLMIALPVSLLVAFGGWRVTGKWQFLPIAPFLVLAWWLSLRASTPPQGQRMPTLRASKLGWPGSIVLLSVCIPIAWMAVARKLGVPPQTVTTVSLVAFASCFLLIFWMVFRVDRQQKRDGTAAAVVAEQRWADGERL